MADASHNTPEDLRDIEARLRAVDWETPALPALSNPASKPVLWLAGALLAAAVIVGGVIWRQGGSRSPQREEEPVAVVPAPEKLAVRATFQVREGYLAVAKETGTETYFPLKAGDKAGPAQVRRVDAGGVEFQLRETTQVARVQPEAIDAAQVVSIAKAVSGNRSKLAASDVCWLGLAARQNIPEAIQLLQDCAGDANFKARELADDLVAGGKLSEVDRLRAILHDKNHKYRALTIAQLASIGSPAATQVLRDVAATDGDPLREKAEAALRRLASGSPEQED